MRNKDVTDDRQRHIGKHKLPRDAVAAVNHIRGVVRDDDLRRRGTDFSRPRTTSRPEENEPGTSALSTERSGTRRCSTRNRRRQKSSTGDDRQFTAILSAMAVGGGLNASASSAVSVAEIVQRGQRSAKSWQNKDFEGQSIDEPGN
jgi:hypothetical protein